MKLTELNDKENAILNSNISFFYGGLYLLNSEYVKSLAIEKVKRNVLLFEDRQKAIDSRTKPTEGDWVKLPDGRYLRLSVVWEESFQASEYSGSVYVSKSGHGSFSGTCGNSYKSPLLATEETKEGSCWIFGDDSSGAHRGIHTTLNWKVWTIHRLTDEH